MMQRLFRKLARSTTGAATIELALVMPILTTMLIGVVDVTTAFNRKLELEQAVQRSIERVRQTTTDETDIGTPQTSQTPKPVSRQSHSSIVSAWDQWGLCIPLVPAPKVSVAQQ